MTADPSQPAAPRRSAPSAAAEKTPAQIGRYRILKKLGSGGMGVVYLAEDSTLHRMVALKVLVKSANTPPNLIKRFSAEAQTGAKLRHPNIVTVFDSGDADGYLFLALDYIDGPDLDRVIRKNGRVPVDRSVEIVRQITRALDHAHAHGIVHRDIKPSNILMRRDGTATLTDLGLARAVDEAAASGITRAGFTVGTVDYMPPEQARSSKAADVRSDLYALGCTWYHMLVGKVPYDEGDLTNKLRAHSQAPPPDPRAVVPEIPAGVAAVVQRLMAKKPEDRYQTPADLLKDLDRPGLRRMTVTDDDLRGLAEEAAEVEPFLAPSDDGSGWTEELVATRPGSRKRALASSSELVEAPRPTPRHRPVPSRSRSRSRRGAPAPKTFERADKIRAVIVAGLLVLLLGVTFWAIAQLDRWVGGTAVPPPERSKQVGKEDGPPHADEGAIRNPDARPGESAASADEFAEDAEPEGASSPDTGEDAATFSE